MIYTKNARKCYGKNVAKYLKILIIKFEFKKKF